MASTLPVLSGQEVVRTFEKLGWRFARQSDYAGLGGVRHIGKSKQPTLSEMLNVVTKLYIFKYSSIIKGKNVNIS